MLMLKRLRRFLPSVWQAKIKCVGLIIKADVVMLTHNWQWEHKGVEAYTIEFGVYKKDEL